MAEAAGRDFRDGHAVSGQAAAMSQDAGRLRCSAVSGEALAAILAASGLEARHEGNRVIVAAAREVR